MREIVSPFSGIPSPFGGQAEGISADRFDRWFLSTGVWDDGGRWDDAAFLWDAPWFLEEGRWNLFGAWDDTKDL